MLLALALFSASALAQPPVPTQGVAELVEQVRALESVDLARAWELSAHARIAAKTPYDRALVELRRAAIQRRRGEYADALATVEAGLASARQLGDQGLEAEYLHLYGLTKWSMTDFPTALEYYRAAAALAERVGKLALAARAHSHAGNTCRDLEDLATADQHYQAGLELGEKSGDRLALADVLNNHGFLLLKLGRAQDSRATHLRALALREELGHRAGMADSYFNLAATADNIGERDEALAYFAKAQAIYEALGYTRNLANLHHSTAEVLRGLGRLDDALAHLRKAEELAKTLNTAQLSANVYEELALVLAAKGDFREAYAYQQKFHQANEQAVGERTRREAAALNARYNAERRQHEIDILQRDRETQAIELRSARTQRYWLLGLLLAGGAAVAAMVRLQRVKRLAERRVLDETRAAKEAAEQADALKTRLVGIASHDLKAPVAAIIAGAQSLRLEPRDPQHVVAMAGAIAGEGHRTLALIRDLLDLSALEQGRLELVCAPVEVASLVRECMEAAGPRATAKALSLNTETVGGAEALYVSADHERLRQALDNLVDNAIKFTPSGRPVSVRVLAPAGVVRIEVRDSGPGLTPQDYLKLFQPFQKLSARPTAGESSTGLGLSIARELVVLHRGQLTVESTPGQGSVFAIELPQWEPSDLASA